MKHLKRPLDGQLSYYILQNKWHIPRLCTFLAVKMYVHFAGILLLEIESYQKLFKSGFEL